MRIRQKFWQGFAAIAWDGKNLPIAPKVSVCLAQPLHKLNELVDTARHMPVDNVWGVKYLSIKTITARLLQGWTQATHSKLLKLSNHHISLTFHPRHSIDSLKLDIFYTTYSSISAFHVPYLTDPKFISTCDFWHSIDRVGFRWSKQRLICMGSVTSCFSLAPDAWISIKNALSWSCS